MGFTPLLHINARSFTAVSHECNCWLELEILQPVFRPCMRHLDDTYIIHGDPQMLLLFKAAIEAPNEKDYQSVRSKIYLENQRNER